jgi:alpha-glucosidase
MEGIDTAEERLAFFKRCREVGVAGVKIDFMDAESKDVIDFYTAALKDAAEYKLMINFHGANKPTGEARTWPNEITREGVRGLEYNKWSALPPQHYAALPFTRYLAGHGDFTPCTFNPDMLKATTVTMQLATAIVYTSPLLHWADKPHFYLNSPAVDLIKQIPSTWDQTIVLADSKIGELAAFARRKDDVWFVGIINAGPERQYDLNLSFLDEGEYNAVLVRDRTDNPADITVENNTVNCEQKLTVEMCLGGGFVARFSR